MTVARRKAAHAQRGKAELNPHDALVLLTAEHNEIDKLLREFERLRKTADSVDKGKAALRVCHALERYAAIKHEVFYPAADAVLTGEDKELLGKAQVKHDGIQDLIDKVVNTPADDSVVRRYHDRAGRAGRPAHEAGRGGALPATAPFEPRPFGHRRTHGGAQDRAWHRADRSRTGAPGPQGHGRAALARNRRRPRSVDMP